MKRILLSFLFVAAIFSLSSCSGVGSTTCTTGCTGGNANLTLSIMDSPPTNSTFLSFNLPVKAITLTNSTGTTVNVFSPANPVSVDLVRLQSDSTVLGTFQVPADTHNSMQVFLDAPSTVWANGSGATVSACPTGTVCNLNGGSPSPVTITFANAVNLTANENTGLGIDFNLNNIITTASNAITFNFAATDAVTTVTLPRTGQTTGALESIEDFTGVIPQTNGNTLTITSATHGVLTGTVSSTTTYTGLFSVGTVCGGSAPSSDCLKRAGNKTVSVDATVSNTGVVSITEVDFIDDPSVDEIEGVIYPTTTVGTFGMVVSDVVNATGNANLNSVGAGSRIQFTLDSSATFAVDTRNLGAAVSGGFGSSSDLVPGQQVMIHVKTATSGTFLAVVTDRLVLRYTRTSATVDIVGGNSFSIQNLPPFFGTFIGPPNVQTFPGITTFDNAADITGISNGDTISFRALYLNPNAANPAFLAAKVRKESSAAAAIAGAKR
jgi:Domain of unknown function (DUF4382)